MGRPKVKKSKSGIQTAETKNFVETVLNDPKEFDYTTFKTHKLSENDMAVYGKRKKDGKIVLHKIMTLKEKNKNDTKKGKNKNNTKI